MSKRSPKFPIEITLRVRDTCLCLHAQRAARALSRKFDDAFHDLGITSGQFSLMMALSRPSPWRIGELAIFLAMDRTTITANLKPLERDCLVSTGENPDDKRSRNVTLTAKGRALLMRAAPIWKRTHREIDKALARDPAQLRGDLMALAKS